MDLGTLRKEVNNDPLGRGYDGMSDQEVADDMNTKYRTRYTSLDGAEILAEIDSAEYENLSSGDQATVRFIMHTPGQHDLSPGSTTRELIKSAFSDQSTTWADLTDRVEQSISRATELGLPEIKAYHVNKVR